VQRPTSPDPVSDPKAYTDHLLGLLGDDDPAAAQAGAVDAWRSLVSKAGKWVDIRPEPSEWSVVECLGHAVDAEVVTAARYRWILAHHEPPLIGYDQDLWVDRLHAGRHDDPDELLSLLDALRRANLSLWADASEEDRRRVGIHAERGPESFELLFRMLAGHDRFHTAQAERALDAVTGS
jgi:hypothetical protein